MVINKLASNPLITPHIFTDNNGQSILCFFMAKIIHQSFSLIICGSEDTDKFTFYLDATASWDCVNDWNSVTDTAVAYSYNYIDLWEVQSNDIFEVKFNFILYSSNERILLTDVSTTCDNITT